MNMARHLTEKLKDEETELPPSTVDCDLLGYSVQCDVYHCTQRSDKYRCFDFVDLVGVFDIKNNLGIDTGIIPLIGHCKIPMRFPEDD